MNLLKQLEGQWKYQQTVYNIKRKKITSYKNFINIDSLNIPNINYDNSQSDINIIINNQSKQINKKCHNNNYIYQVEKSGEVNIKISYMNKNILFKEIIRKINKNFFFVIGIMKYYNKYTYISVASYIKIL